MWVHIKKLSLLFIGLAYPESLTWLVSISLAPYSKSPHTISLSLYFLHFPTEPHSGDALEGSFYPASGVLLSAL